MHKVTHQRLSAKNNVKSRTGFQSKADWIYHQTFPILEFQKDCNFLLKLHNHVRMHIIFYT